MAFPTWNFGPQISSQRDADRQRSIAEALIAQSATPASNVGQGFADIAAALSGTVLGNRVSEAETAGRATAADALAGLTTSSDFGSIAAALNNPWISDQQSSIASALLGQSLQRSDPAYQLGLEKTQLELDALRNPVAAPFTLGEGQQRFNGDGSVLATGLPSSPDTIINNGDNSGAFNKKSDELAATRFDSYINDGVVAQQMMGDLNTLAALGTQINTGKTAEVMNVLGPYAEALGVNIEGLGESQAYQSIVDRMAPAMRPAGSGSSSDTDVRMFLNGLPSLGKTPEGNRIITETFSAVQQQKMRAAEIASEATQGLKTWQQADAEIRALGNPYEAFNEYRRRSGVNVQNGQVIQAPNGVTIRKMSD